MQHSSYYPFGMSFAMKEFGAIGNEYANNKYLYNGKELQDDMLAGKKLDWYDYGARMYDPALGRWHSIDPMAELTPRWTPYRYGFNNPLRFIDPNGMSETDMFGRRRYDDNGNIIPEYLRDPNLNISKRFPDPFKSSSGTNKVESTGNSAEKNSEESNSTEDNDEVPVVYVKDKSGQVYALPIDQFNKMFTIDIKTESISVIEPHWYGTITVMPFTTTSYGSGPIGIVTKPLSKNYLGLKVPSGVGTTTIVSAGNARLFADILPFEKYNLKVGYDMQKGFTTVYSSTYNGVKNGVEYSWMPTKEFAAAATIVICILLPEVKAIKYVQKLVPAF